LNKPKRLGVVALLGALALVACSPPKYVNYWSIWQDWRTSVPWGWHIRTESQSSAFASTNLTGPFSPDFYRGWPSFGVRWYENNTAHTLPDGLVEFYKNGDDYMKQMLEGVYTQHELVVKEEGKDPIPGEYADVEISGQVAQHHLILSYTKPSPGATWGIMKDRKTGERTVARLHEYFIVQLPKGFYVLVYPATANAYDVYAKQFHYFVNQFYIAKQGPGGPPVPSLVDKAASSK
jgi:hypothetical protein